MLKLNIIPDATKKDIKKRIILKSLQKFIFILTLITLVYSVFVYGLKIYMQYELNKIVKKIETNTTSSSDYKQKMQSYNEEIKNINLIYNDFVAWSYFVEYLNNHINENIEISRLNLNKERDEITISGLAKTRDDLLLFKETLDSFGIIAEINIPINNLLEKENIKFTISSNFTSYEFGLLP